MTSLRERHDFAFHQAAVGLLHFPTYNLLFVKAFTIAAGFLACQLHRHHSSSYRIELEL